MNKTSLSQEELILIETKLDYVTVVYLNRSQRSKQVLNVTLPTLLIDVYTVHLLQIALPLCFSLSPISSVAFTEQTRSATEMVLSFTPEPVICGGGGEYSSVIT